MGIIFAVIGIFLQASNHHYFDFFNNSLLNIPVISTSLGCSIFFISSLGYLGVMMSNNNLLLLYAILMTSSLILEVASISIISKSFTRIVKMFTVLLEDGMNNYAKPDYRGVTNTWDVFQHEVYMYRNKIF